MMRAVSRMGLSKMQPSFVKIFVLFAVLFVRMDGHSGCNQGESGAVDNGNATAEERTRRQGQCNKETVVKLDPAKQHRTEWTRQDDSPPGDGDGDGAILYDPSVTINPPVEAPADDRAGCDYSTALDILATEMMRVTETYVRDDEDTKRQLQQLHDTVADIAGTLMLSDRSASSLAPTMVTSVSDKGTPARDCSDVLASGVVNSTVYTIRPVDNGESVEVYCDMDTDGGGWTVFQRRQDGSVDFYRDFESYRQGFGSRDGEFWLGNDNLHRLTAQEDYELRVDLTDFQGNAVYARYNSFTIGDVSDFYRLTVGEYSGTAGDSMSSHNDKRFSTKDRDNDDWLGNCAEQFVGAWWYSACFKSHLNGRYSGELYQGIAWFAWKGNYDPLKKSEMKLRKKS